MRIYNNIPAMTATRNYGIHVQNVGKSIYRLSSGKKLLTDDPAGAIIASKLQARIRGLSILTRSTEETIDILNTASGEALGRQNILQRMRELSIRLATDTLSQDEKSMLLAELTELAKEFSLDTFRNTGMEIIAVGNGSLSDELMYKKGDLVYNEGKWIKLSELEEKWAKEGKLDLDSATVLEGTKIEGPSADSEDKPTNIAITKKGLTEHIDDIMKSNLMSVISIGAVANALSFRLERLYSEEENAIAALSRIEDVDMAKEIADFLKESILCKVSLAIAAQANAQPKHVLTLLESIS